MLKKEMLDWIYCHPNVIQSSNTKDTIKVKIDGSSEKVTVPKFYLQIPIHELHQDLIKDQEYGGLSDAKDVDGDVIIGETSLRKFIPKNVKQMAFQKRDVCACETCVSAYLMQSSINM